MTNFHKKLDEWHDEPIEISTIDPVIRNGKVVGTKEGTRIVKQKVRYSKISEPYSVSCAENDHFYTIPDKHNHVAVCRNCPKRVFIRAVFEKVSDGKIIERPTSLTP